MPRVPPPAAVMPPAPTKSEPPRAAPPPRSTSRAPLPPLARPATRPPTGGQDFGFLHAAPAKPTPTPPAPKPERRAAFPALESEVVRKAVPTGKSGPPPVPAEAQRARTVRLAPSPRPRLDATTVAKKRMPKR
ncbi:hypothetical protein [Sandaracinus amylolyticus]|uniref:Outer membrane protein, OmpA/MotB family n=1 Tax=Sandaracinus amylolyticus TaxID=927083 RepID=A0A0F6VZU7_9BACT|nr:hypothetical protein [Sandaracinus amylolyticus]AKF03646.1 Outer membrane protein, OmpA/MotB family [Sandaracinus amylolyticus]